MATTPPAASEITHRKLAAVMFTDTAGFSATAQEDEQRALRLRDEQARVVRPFFAQHHGTEIKSTGDGYLVEFDNTLDAVRCAVAIQTALVTRNRETPHEDRIHIRIGIHVCDVVHKDGDILGDGVNIAARLEPLSDADGICISEDVARQLHGKIEQRLEKLPHTQLKNIILPMDAYRVCLPWTQRRRRHPLKRLTFIAAGTVIFFAGFAAGYNWQSTLGPMRHNRAVLSLAYSADGGVLASASDDTTIKLWKPESQSWLFSLIGLTQHEIRKLTGHTRRINSVAFSHDDKWLVSGSDDHTARVWQAASGKPVFELKHPRPVNDAQISPDGKLIATAGTDEKVRLWDATTGHLVRELQGEDAINVARFSPDGQVVAAAGDDERPRIWSVTTGRELATLIGHSGFVLDVAFSPDGQWLATASSDRTIKLWKVTTGSESHTLAGHTDVVNGICFSSDGHLLASGSPDGTVRIWDVTDGREVRQLKGLGGVNAVACSKDGSIAWGTEDGDISSKAGLLNP